MNGLTNMGLSSNEAKEQRIMKLRRDFNDKKVITVQGAVEKTGYSAATIIKYAKEGEIPLWDKVLFLSIIVIALNGLNNKKGY